MKKIFSFMLFAGIAVLLSSCEFQSETSQVDVEYDLSGDLSVNKDAMPNEDDVLVLPEPGEQEDTRGGNTYKLEFSETYQQGRGGRSLTFPNHILVSKTSAYSCTLKSCNGKTAFSSDMKNYDNIVKELSGSSFARQEYLLLQKNEDETIKIDQFKPNFKVLTLADGEQTSDLNFSKSELPQVFKLNGYHYLNGDYVSKNNVIILDEVRLAPRFESFNMISKETNTNYKEQFYFYGMVNNTSKNIKFEKSLYNPVGNNFSLTFHGFDRKTKPKIKTTLSEAGDISDVSWNENNYKINLENLKKNTDYKFEMRFEENGYSYTYKISFKTLDNFKVSNQEQLKNDDKEYTNTYAMCLSQPVDKKSVLKTLIENLGEENFTFHKRGYDNNYGYGHTSTKYYGNNCFSFTYFGNPKNDRKIVLKDVESNYGKKINVSFTFKKYVLSKNQSYLKLIGTPVTIMPKTKGFNDTLQVVSKNKNKGIIYYRECLPLSEYPEKIMEQFKNTKQKKTDISRNLLACNSSVKSFSFDINNTERRKEKLNNIQLSKVFGDDIPNIIEIGLNRDLDKNPGYLYMRTNIGLFAKYSPKNLHIWANDMQTGKPIKNLSYTVGYYDSSKKEFVIDKANMQNGYLHYEFPEDIKVGFFYGIKGSDTALIMLPMKDLYLPNEIISNNSRYQKNAFGINAYELGGRPYWYQPKRYNIFAFTDRALYKPGSEDLFVSGWIRTAGKYTVAKGNLEVSLYDSENQIIDSQTVNDLDSFGGFKASFEIPENAELGRYRVDCRYQPSDGGDEIRYNVYVQVEEFKKSTISIESEINATDKKTMLRITPKYYFGQYLEEYDVNLSYTLKPKNYGIRDWDWCGKQWCDSPIYYNNPNQNNASASGGYLQIKNYQGKYLDLDLNLKSPTIANFNVDVTLIDDTTKEVVFKSLQEKVLPTYLVGIEGWDYDWFNKEREGEFTLKGRLLNQVRTDKETLDNYSLLKKNAKVEVKIYYKDFGSNQSVGPDGEYYYSYGESYKLDNDFKLSVSDGLFEKNINFKKNGDYIIVVNYDGTYQNVQHVYVYDSSYERDYFYGQLDNNYKLNLFVKDKEYESGEDIEINIEPYIKGATAIVTVEKDGEILQQKTVNLDGNPITVKARKEWYPNASIGVLQVLGEDVNKKISAEREEPRFMAGYTNVILSPSMMGIDFDVILTNENGSKQDYYYPGQKVKLTIKAKDSNGKGLKTRLSVGIVDKALTDIYDQVRKPLKRFYKYTSPGFHILSNYHIIFKILRVFDAENDSKGGGGGDSQDMGGPRKKFMDLAFWRGGTITNSNGIATFTTTLPDNLTTRVIDIIGLGQNGEMDTYREYFTVSKDVIVSMYLPRFISPYGTVRIPVSVISNKEVDDAELRGAIRIGDYKKDIVIKTKNDESYFDLSIDDIPLQDLLLNDSVKIYIAAGNYDSMVQYLPIRKENMFVKDFKFFEGEKISETIKLEGDAKYAVVTANISTLPIAQISNAIKYLLRYPYGCTEQLLSSLYPTLVAAELGKKGYLESDIIRNGEINYQGNRKEISSVIENTLEKIYRNQNPSGTFGYWNANSEGNVSLSIYVYHVLTYIKSMGYEIDNDIYLKLEKALIDFSDTSTHMDFLFQKVLAGKTIGLQKVDELLKKDGNLKNKIMAYTIYAYHNKNRTDLYTEIISELKKYNNGSNYYSAYSSKNILKSYFVRGLTENGLRIESWDYIGQLLKETDKNGRRGWSTQENMQILRAIAHYLEGEESYKKTINASININGQVKNIELGKQGTGDFVTYKTLTWVIGDLDKFKFNMTADEKLMSSVKIEYIPESPLDFVSKSENVSKLGLEGISLKELNSAKVGEIIDVKGIFKIEESAQQVAVVYNIPVYTYIMNTIGQGGSYYGCRGCWYDYYDDGMNNKNEVSFKKLTDTNKRYNCRPDHYEVRYDRLFLYYDQLPAGASCEVDFAIMKTHVGVINVLSNSFFEMYVTNVWGTNYME